MQYLHNTATDSVHKHPLDCKSDVCVYKMHPCIASLSMRLRMSFMRLAVHDSLMFIKGIGKSTDSVTCWVRASSAQFNHQISQTGTVSRNEYVALFFDSTGPYHFTSYLYIVKCHLTFFFFLSHSPLALHWWWSLCLSASITNYHFFRILPFLFPFKTNLCLSFSPRLILM